MYILIRKYIINLVVFIYSLFYSSSIKELNIIRYKLYGYVQYQHRSGIYLPPTRCLNVLEGKYNKGESLYDYDEIGGAW